MLEHDEDCGWIKFGFEGKPEFLNPAGRVQGGFLTAMLDTMGPVVLLNSGGASYPSSIDMNVSFLAAAKPGPLVCEGEVLRLGKTVGFVEGRLMDSDGRLIARATSSIMLVLPSASADEVSLDTLPECHLPPGLRGAPDASSVRAVQSFNGVVLCRGYACMLGGTWMRCTSAPEIAVG